MAQSAIRKMSLAKAADRFLESVDDRSSSANFESHTRRSFAYALRKFLEVIEQRARAKVGEIPAIEADPEWIRWYIDWLKRQKIAPATERLRLVAVQGLYNFLSAEGVNCNPGRVKSIIQQRATPVPNKEQPLDLDDVEALLRWAQKHVVAPHRSKWEKLRALRDYAFLVLLADTGLRVGEACSLNLSALPRPNVSKPKIVVSIKGGDALMVRLSPRAWRAIRAYLRVRAPLDKALGIAKGDLAAFAQHSRLADGKEKRLTGKVTVRRWEPSGVRAFFHDANEELFTEIENERRPGQRGYLTPHSLRHYFVTKILRRTGNIRMAQKLARHKAIASTQRYAHIDDETLDKTYGELFGDK
jgi:site-specific recombinase XerD